MKGLLRSIVYACVLCICVACGMHAALPLLEKSASESDDFLARVQPPERWTLPNGLVVMFARDDELPLVTGTLFMRGGALLESMSELGIAGAMGDQMRQGGAGKYSPDGLDQRLEELSASVASSVGQEFGKVEFACLSSDFSEVLGIVSDVVLRPRFDETRLSLWRDRARESMRRRADDPGTIASLSFNQLIYGHSPYGWPLTNADLGRFTRANLLKAHAHFIRPNGAMLTIVGRVDREEVAQLVASAFGGWKPATQELPNPPAIQTTVTPGIYFIERRLQQSTIIAGQRGVPRLSPDHVAIEAFNSIFGTGGFGSRLMRRVRTEGGMAYSVYGAIVPAVTQGRNLVYIQTKTDSTAPALLRSLGELITLKDEAPSETELTENRSALLNSFIFGFDSRAKVLSRRATLELLRYPSDYDQRYINGVRALNPEDIRKVAQTRWDLAEFVVVVVGDARAREALQQLHTSTDFSPDLSEREQRALHALRQLPLKQGRFDERFVLVEED